MSTSVQGGRPIYTRGRKIPDNRSSAVRETVEFFKQQQARGMAPQEVFAPLSGDPELDADVGVCLQLMEVTARREA